MERKDQPLDWGRNIVTYSYLIGELNLDEYALLIICLSKMSCNTIALHIDLVYKPLIDERSHQALYRQCRRFKIASQLLKIEIPTDYVLEFPDSSDQVWWNWHVSTSSIILSSCWQMSEVRPLSPPGLTWAPAAPPPQRQSLRWVGWGAFGPPTQDIWRCQETPWQDGFCFVTWSLKIYFHNFWWH